MKLISAFAIGILFGLGIAVSGMANPAKVLNFFDIAGTWDPSLIFVMGGALITTFIGYRVLFATRQTPVLDGKFALPTSRVIDVPLVGGSVLFGIGWGITGFCPGGAVPALGLGDMRVFIFMAAMTAGLVAARILKSLGAKPATA